MSGTVRVFCSEKIRTQILSLPEQNILPVVNFEFLIKVLRPALLQIKVRLYSGTSDVKQPRDRHVLSKVTKK